MKISLPVISRIFVSLGLAVAGGTGAVWYWNHSTNEENILKFLENEGNRKNVETMVDYLTVIDKGENKDIFKDFKNKHDEKNTDTDDGKKWINWKSESFHALLKNLKDKFEDDSIMDRENLTKLTETMKKISGTSPSATQEEISQVPELFNKFFEQIKEIGKHTQQQQVS